MTITKEDIISEVVKDTGCRKKLVSEMVDSIITAMRKSLINSDRIEIRGFGIFQVKDTKAKPAALNPDAYA